MYENLQIDITSNDQPAAETDLRQFERKLGTLLPREYRQFLKERNGGRVAPNVFVGASGPDYGCGVSEFLGINLQDSTRHHSYELYASRLPDNYLPVATAPGGNLICLQVGNANPGSVYFWDHELDITNSNSGGEAFRKLIDSFSDFVHSLRPLRPDEVKLRQEDVIEAWIDPEFLEQQKNSE